jgi:uncharacterized protein (TIGR00645 family)
MAERSGSNVALTQENLTQRFSRNLRRSVLAARWIMVPIYVGLLGALCLLAVKFVQELVAAIPGLLSEPVSETIMAALTMIDLSLVANLVLIVIFAGWENFLGPLVMGSPTESGPAWLGDVDFSGIKLKLISSAAAIAVIQILETFMHIEAVQKPDAIMRLAILIGIAVAGVLLAAMDRVSGGGH